MKKMLLILAATVLSWGYAFSQTSGDVIELPFYEPFNMRDTVGPDPSGSYDDLLEDPDFYAKVRERWSFRIDSIKGLGETPEGLGQKFDYGNFGESDGLGEKVDYFDGNSFDGFIKLFINRKPIDAWMIMNSPCYVENTCYVSFMLRSDAGVNVEETMPIEVMYTATPEDLASWQTAGVVNVRIANLEGWRTYVSDNLNLNSGEYYFAFRVNEGENNANMVFFDEVHIVPSRFVSYADLTLQKIKVPAPNCELPSVNILELDIKNSSSCKVKGINYMVNITKDGTSFVSFADSLKDLVMNAGQVQTIALENHPVDFSQLGNYNIQATVWLKDTEDYKADTGILVQDNVLDVQTRNAEPMPLPAVFDFVYDEEAYLWWSSEDPKAWRKITNGIEATNEGKNEPLVSTCIHFDKPGDYTFRWCLLAGRQPSLEGQYVSKESYQVRIGKVGESDADATKWTLIKEEHDVLYMPTSFNDKQLFQFTVPEAGDYRFAIINTTADNYKDYVKVFNFSSIEIDELGPDYRVDDLYSNIFENRVPKKQLTWNYPMLTTVSNIGSGSHEATIELSLNGTVLGESDPFTLPEGGKKVVSTTMKFPKDLAESLTSNSTYTITATVKMDGDIYEGNNSQNYRFIATDDVLGIDESTSIRGGTLVYFTGASSIGRVFNLMESDTLTAVNYAYGGGKTAGECPMGLKVCALDTVNKKISTVYYHSSSLIRELADKEVTLEIPPVILPAGVYVLLFTQETAAGALMLSADYSFNYTTKTVVLAYDNETYSEMNVYGNLWARAIFGKGAKVSETDLAVDQIRKPHSIGSFSANEPVIAEITNLSADTQKEVSVYLDIDGTVSSVQVPEIPAKETVEVELEGDLSALGEHTVKVYVSLEEDLNKANDTAVITVECMEAQDPYFLDFESCPDFVLDGFNPNWKSVDRDGAASWIFPELDYTRPSGPFAFMAFNSGDDTKLNTHFPAYDGKKIGLSVSPSSEDAVGDDWLVSPLLPLGDAPSLEFFVRQNTEIGYGSTIATSKSEYEVYVSTTSDDVNEMYEEGAIANGLIDDGSEDWQQVNVDLADYAGKSVYVGIRFISYYDSWVSMIDNVRVNSDLASSEEGEVQEHAVRLYPNPARTQVSLMSGNVIEQVRIFSANGKTVYEARGIESGEYRINVEKFLPGLYFVQVVTDKGSSVQKLVVE